VERHQRRLHREAEEREEEDDHGELFAREPIPAELHKHRRGEFARAPLLREHDEVESARGLVNREEREQQRDAADHGVDEELQRRAMALRAAPELHEEERRDKREFPVEEPVEKVQRRERTDEAALEEKDERVVKLRLVGDAARREQRHRRHDGREQQEREAQAVHADEVFDVERGNPRVSLDELDVRRGAVEVRHEANRQPEREERQRESEPTRQRFVLHAEQQRRADHRQQGEEGNEREVGHALLPSQSAGRNQGRLSGALEARNKTAQGNALGSTRSNTGKPCKGDTFRGNGRRLRVRLCRPFRA
jgi:hypothetical protein